MIPDWNRSIITFFFVQSLKNAILCCPALHTRCSYIFCCFPFLLLLSVGKFWSCWNCLILFFCSLACKLCGREQLSVNSAHAGNIWANFILSGWTAGHLNYYNVIIILPVLLKCTHCNNGVVWSDEAQEHEYTSFSHVRTIFSFHLTYNWLFLLFSYYLLTTPTIPVSPWYTKIWTGGGGEKGISWWTMATWEKG